MTKHKRFFVLLFLVALPVGRAAAEPAASTEDDEGVYSDGFHALVNDEAREALANGNLNRAWDLFAWLVRLNPNDASALRELGRVAAARGAFREAERALSRCFELRGNAPDPEARFIRGEALLALGRREEAIAELDAAEAELRYVRDARLAEIWKSRIYTLRGDAAGSAAILERLLPDKSDAGYQEIAMLLSESYILSGRTDEAIKLLNECLENKPSERGQDMLAWALARAERPTEELALREQISLRWDGDKAPGMVAYARALEQADQPSKALDYFVKAEERGNNEVAAEIERLSGLTSPEVMFLGEFGDHPTGQIAGATAATLVPASDSLSLAAITKHHRLIKGGDEATSSASAFAKYRLPSGDEVAVGGTAWRDAGESYQGGASGAFVTKSSRIVSAYLRGDYNAPWLESATALREGGASSSVELQMFAKLFTPKLVLVGAGRVRKLTLQEMPGTMEVSAIQQFGAVGLDWIAYNSDRAARGSSLGPNMLLPAHFSSALVFSYRHYEVLTDGDLSPRLFLVDRSRIDELSMRARRVVDDGGILSIGANGGLGYDTLRDARLWRVGGELLLSLHPMVRLTVSSELATETTSGLTGKRLIGLVGLNADL